MQAAQPSDSRGTLRLTAAVAVALTLGVFLLSGLSALSGEPEEADLGYREVRAPTVRVEGGGGGGGGGASGAVPTPAAPPSRRADGEDAGGGEGHGAGPAPGTAPPPSSADDHAELAGLLARRTVYYPLDAGGWQHLEYVLALYDWTGGLVGLPSDRPGFGELDTFLRAHGVKTVLEPASRVAARMQDDKYASVLLHEGFPPSRHTGRLWHGLSEKDLLTGKKGVAPGSELYARLGPLNMARYLHNSTYFTPAEVRRALGVLDGRRVVLFLLTWADHSMLVERGEEVLDAMRRLGERYHVLVKPHPLLIGGGSRWRPPPAAAKIADVATLIPYTYFNLATTLQLADIVLGEVSGSTVVAPFWSERPLVYLRHAKYHAVADRHPGEVLSWNEVQLLDENNITSLVETVQETLENGEPMARERAAARHAYYVRKNGEHRDGEIGLRHALHALRDANRA